MLVMRWTFYLMLVMRFADMQWPAPLSLRQHYAAQYQFLVVIISLLLLHITNSTVLLISPIFIPFYRTNTRIVSISCAAGPTILNALPTSIVNVLLLLKCLKTYSFSILSLIIFDKTSVGRQHCRYYFILFF